MCRRAQSHLKPMRSLLEQVAVRVLVNDESGRHLLRAARPGSLKAAFIMMPEDRVQVVPQKWLVEAGRVVGIRHVNQFVLGIYEYGSPKEHDMNGAECEPSSFLHLPTGLHGQLAPQPRPTSLPRCLNSRRAQHPHHITAPCHYRYRQQGGGLWAAGAWGSGAGVASTSLRPDTV